MKNVGIIGCGWLGFALGQKWRENNWKINGTVRKAESAIALKNIGITPYIFELGGSLEKEFYSELDLIVICLPISSKNAMNDYKNLVKQVALNKETQTCILLTSSISVYNQMEGVLDEYTTIKDQSTINFRMEEACRKSFNDQLTIVRLGGLISEDRHPITVLAGKKQLKNGTEVINLVHRNDVVNMLDRIAGKNAFGHVYNCVYPYHPLKSAYYQSEAEKRQLVAPTYEVMVNQQRIINSNKSEEELDFTYQFPI